MHDWVGGTDHILHLGGCRYGLGLGLHPSPLNPNLRDVPNSKSDRFLGANVDETQLQNNDCSVLELTRTFVETGRTVEHFSEADRAVLDK